MNITLTMSSADRTTCIRLFKDPSSPNSYKEFVCAVSASGEEFQRTVPALEIQGLLQGLLAARVSPFVPGEMGFGGVTFELTIEDDSSRASYRWWNTPGEGWRDFTVVTGQLTRLAASISGRYLP